MVLSVNFKYICILTFFYYREKFVLISFWFFILPFSIQICGNWFFYYNTSIGKSTIRGIIAEMNQPWSVLQKTIAPLVLYLNLIGPTNQTSRLNQRCKKISWGLKLNLEVVLTEEAMRQPLNMVESHKRWTERILNHRSAHQWILH